MSVEKYSLEKVRLSADGKYLEVPLSFGTGGFHRIPVQTILELVQSLKDLSGLAIEFTEPTK